MQRERLVRRREVALERPAVERRVRGCGELRVKRPLRDRGDLVEAEHLRALDRLARRHAARVAELEAPPTPVRVLLRVEAHLADRLPARVVRVQDVVVRVVEDLEILLGEERDDEVVVVERDVVGLVEAGVGGEGLVVTSI